MIANIPFLQQKFDEFNRLCFNGSLPSVPIKLGRAKTYVGPCRYQIRRRLFGKDELYDFRLVFSTRFDLPEDEMEDTVIHEMIHYYIGVNGIRDTSTHGKVFRQMMNDINARYGRHVTISLRGKDAQVRRVADERPRPHVVALVELKDGKKGIRVLPVNARRIRSFRFGMIATGKVRSMELYSTTDPYFNQYPCSSALKIFFADMAEVRGHLEDAEALN